MNVVRPLVRRSAVWVAALAVAGASLTPLPAYAQPAAMHDVVVTMRVQTQLGDVSRAGGSRATHRRLLERLRSTAGETQRPVQRAVSRLRAAGEVDAVTSYWISNSLSMSATDSAIATLRSLPQVLSVTPDAMIAAAPIVETVMPAEPNLTQVTAPDLWAKGLRGDGVVVAVLDTGADLTHPDLAASYRGGANSWFDPFGEHPTGPVDLSGHGTWTTGVAVGGSAGGSAIGVAPAARWIAARVFNDAGQGSVSAIHAALQWAVDPDSDPTTDDGADVINNSWSLGSPGCNLTFQPDLQALRALDVVPVFAAGNGGPGASSSYSPANYPEALSVGSVDSRDLVLGDSSRGPSTCGGRSRVFPDVTAPGRNIRTSDRYGQWTTASGTSLAAPHATGALALLLSGNHSLSADQQVAAVLTGARDLGANGPDNAYGAGRLDVAGAWATLTPPLDGTGPLVTGVSVTPDPSDLAEPPAVHATADDSASGGSGVVAAELFVDAPGPDGAGFPMALANAGAVRTDLSGALPTTLGGGWRDAYVHARDAAGQWGPWATRSFLVDRFAPVLSSPTVGPSPPNGSTITITVDASDDAGVAGATVTENGVSVPQLNTSLVPADGTYGGTSEHLTTTIDVSSWRVGQHLLTLAATDVAGRSAAAVELSVNVGPADLIFADGFETGSTTRWSRTVGGARLQVATSEVLAGSVSLLATIAGDTPSYVQDDSPLAASAYRARFWFDPNGTRTRSGGHDVLTGVTGSGALAFHVVYRRTAAGLLQLRSAAKRSGGQTWTSWVTITDAPHPVEVAWTAGTVGTLTLFVDGSPRGTVSVANASTRLEAVRLGPSTGLSSTSAGTEIFDAFASTRSSPIRP